jgi:H+-transporting ATPase
LPVVFGAGEKVLMGATVVRFEAVCVVSETGMRTFYGKTAIMLAGGRELTSLEMLLLKITLVMVILSLVLCFSCFGYLLAMGERWREALSFTVVLIVASIPIAITVVCTVTLALGSRYALVLDRACAAQQQQQQRQQQQWQRGRRWRRRRCARVRALL